MFIRQWMTRDVQSVTPETLMMTAARLMKSRRVRRLPVVDDKGRLIGIVTDRDIKEASPSKATSLDIHELYYLLSEIKVADVMTKNPIALHPDDTLERAVIIMGERRYGGLPVVDDHQMVVGVISYSDVFRVITDMMGIKRGGMRIIMDEPAQPKIFARILSELADKEVLVVSVLSFPGEPDRESRRLYIRLIPPEDIAPARIIDLFEAHWPVISWGQDTPVSENCECHDLIINDDRQSL